MLESVTQFTENYLNKKSDRLQKSPNIFYNKSGAEHSAPTPLCNWFFLQFFYCFSAPLSRLAPIEALPQAPTGLCPVPTMGFTPWPWPGACPCTFCSLRSCVLLPCIGDLLGMALPFLTPHSSLKNYALSTLSRFVVPLIPSGTPAVITTRSPFFR